MPAISQKYNAYLQGMSDQPDEIMKPGQLKDSLNTFPDVTFGLLKRPSLGFLDHLSYADPDGCWGSYYRVDATGARSEYVINITQSGNIRVWDATNGVPQIVNIGGTIDSTDGSVTGGSTDIGATLAYAVNTDSKDIGFTTILDTTIINNRTISPRMSSVVEPVNHCEGNYYAYVAVNTLAYGQNYTFDIEQKSDAEDEDPMSVSYRTPTTGNEETSIKDVLETEVTDPPDTDNPGGGLVPQLQALMREDGSTPFFNICIRIGNGIYMETDLQFSINTSEGQLFDIMAVSVDEPATDAIGQRRYASVQTVAQLPLECRHNMVLKIKNSIAEEDDYYVKFLGNQEVDGEGVWEETVEPGTYNQFQADVMPHVIRRGPETTPGVFTFVVSTIPWEPRLVGDELTNPLPSFINREDPDNDFGRPPIQRVLFYRNRLAMLAGENILMSRPGDYFNFFSVSALNVSVSDPIDTAATSQYSSLLLDGIVVNSGLVLFSEFQQFLLTTDSDLLSSQTVKISSLASYDFNPKTNPFSMGNTLGFFSTAGINSRLYEMYEIFREGEPDIIEQSKIINRRLPADLTLIADSKENGLIMSSDLGSSDIWCYRYFNQGRERLQSAWFRWKIIGELIYHVIMGDEYFAVINNGGDISLVSMDLSKRYTTTSVDGTQFDYRIHLDYENEITTLTYLDPKTSTDPNAGYTTFSLAGYPILNSDLKAYSLDNGGNYATVQTYDNGGTLYGKVPGNWTINSGTLHIGYNYDMEVDFPRIFLNSDSVRGGVTDTTASLTIHRCKLSMGPQGVYSTVLTRKGRDDYIINYSSLNLDAAKFNEVALNAQQVNTINIYSNNYNFNLSLQSEHPGPCTLYSMSWEGMYSTLNYRRSN